MFLYARFCIPRIRPFPKTAEIVEEKRAKTARHEKSITRLRWKNAGARQTKKAHVEDDVFLCADVRNVPDGTGAKIKVVEKCADGYDKDIAALDATVSGGKIECAWKVIYAEDEEAEDDDADGDGYVRLRKMKRGKYFISIAD